MLKSQYRFTAISLTIAILVLGIFATTATQAASFAPTNLKAQPLSQSSVRFQWTAGQGNIWYCVDTARSLPDLVQLSGSWRNHGCWTTNTTLDVQNLRCDTTYYWRVYAWNHTMGGHSQVASVQTPPCVMGAPTGLNATPLNNSSVRLDWVAGTNNRWYCIDVAQSLDDLNGLKGSWRNYGCWTTATTITINDLPCGIPHYWAVYSWNENANAKSAPSSFVLSKCHALAPIDDLRIDALESLPVRYRLHIEAGLPNGCHEPGSHTVTRDGKVITVVVRNNVVGAEQCTLIYGTYEIGIDLGTDFQTGVKYTVIVNDQTVTFRAQ